MASKNLPPTIGRYQVIDRIGQGGMGLVYRGRDARIGGRFVAIKLLHVSDDDLRDRFLREAGTAGSLKHPNIVTIYDYGEHDGQPFIVMEYVEGVTLSETIRSQVELSLARKLEIMGALVNGLHYAHNKGIVHRDIKPANVMIDHDDVLKIVDFGIAHVADSSMTQAGTMMGTPNYMSPEQVQGRAIDRRSDIFSVGLVFYELLSSRQAFSGETMHHVLTAIVHGEPAPIGEVCPGLDPAIEAIVNRAMRKNPAERYQTLGEFAADLASVGKQPKNAGITWRNSTVTVLTPPPSAPAPSGRPGTDRNLLSKRRAERIERLLPVAQLAFDRGDFAAAIEACEEAALLDPEEPRVRAAMERARTALDAQRVSDWLAEARRCLDQQDADRASQLVEQALALDPASIDAQRALETIAGLKRRQEDDRERERRIAAALARARQSLSSGQFETAIRAAGEILIHDPTHQEAHELTREALRLLDQRRQQEAMDQAAHAVVEQQRATFASGRAREAIEALEGFAPPHPVVSAALAQMRQDLADIERRAAEEDARQRHEAAEAERRREAQVRWVSRQLELARSSIDARQFGDAIEALRHLAQVVPDVPGLDPLLDTALAGQAAVEAETRRAREIGEKLTDAAGARARGQLAEERVLLDAVLDLAPDHAEAAARRSEVDADIAARERAGAEDTAARAAIDNAQRAFDAGRRAEAIAALASFSPPHDLVARAHKSLEANLAALQRAEATEQAMAQAERALTNGGFAEALQALDEADALSPHNSRGDAIRARARSGLEEQRRAEEHTRRASAETADARARFAAGDTKSALKLLERFSPPHPVTSEALSQLRAELAARDEQQRRAEQEQRRKAGEERAAEIDIACEHARAEIADGRFSDALERLRRLGPSEGRIPRVRTLIEYVQIAQAAADEQRKSEEHERQARAAAADARARFAAGDEKEAVRLLERFIPPHAIASEALSALRTEIAARDAQRRTDEERRRREEEEQRRREEAQRAARIDGACKQARADIDRGQYLDAVQTLRRLEEAEGRIPAARKLIAEAQAAHKHQEAKARDAERRQARERETRENQATPLPQPASRRFNTRALWLGGLAAALLMIVGLVYLLRGAPRTEPPPTGSGRLTTAEVGAIVGESEGRLNKGDLGPAARQVGAALARSPDNPDLQRLLQAIFDAADRQANSAKRAAEAARASGLPEFVAGTTQLQSALKSRASAPPQQAESAIREYLAAEKLFNDAARSVPVSVDTSDNLRNARRLLGADNLTGAVHEVVAGLQRAPDNNDLKQTLQQILGAAEDRANAAKRGAGGSDLSRAPEYGRATADLVAAAAARRSARVEDAEPAVRNYVDAAGAFMAAVNTRAQTLLKQGNLVDAAHVAAVGLRGAPVQPDDLRKTLRQTLETAARRANTAKQKADGAGATRRSEYADATSKLKSANDSSHADRLEQTESAVHGSADAETLFGKAATLGPPPDTGTTPGSGTRNGGPGPTATVDIGPILAGADRETKQGNLGQAAHQLVDGLRRAPANVQLTSKLREILGNAQTAANAAKRDADGAAASGRNEYVQGASRVEAAANSSRGARAEDAESAIRDYLAAAELFKTAVTGMERDARARAAADRDAIDGLLNQYEAAYTSLDAEAVSRIDPSKPSKALQDGFKEYKSARLTFAPRDISVNGDRATVHCSRQIDIVLKRGNDAQHATTPVTVTLQRSASGWTIVGIK